MLDKTTSAERLHKDHPDIVSLRDMVRDYLAERPYGKQGVSPEIQRRVEEIYNRERDMLDGLSCSALGDMIGLTKAVVWRLANWSHEKKRQEERKPLRRIERARPVKPVATALKAQTAVVMPRPSVRERDPEYVASLARALVERNKRLNLELAMTPAQVLMGEPPPGRSALDQRRAAMTREETP